MIDFSPLFWLAYFVLYYHLWCIDIALTQCVLIVGGLHFTMV